LPLLIALCTLCVALRAYRKVQSRSKTPTSSSIPSSPRSLSPEKSPILQVPTEKRPPPSISTNNGRLARNNDEPPKFTSGPKRVQGKKPAKTVSGRRANNEESHPLSIQPVIFFASLTTTTERYANVLLEDLRAVARERADLENREYGLLPPQIHDISYIDFDDFFAAAPKPPSTSPGTRYLYCILIPTYNIDTVLNTLLGHLDEIHNDFRIDTAPLSQLAGYSVFGLVTRKSGPPRRKASVLRRKKLIAGWRS
jgi:tRNA wybutosine-synthesizing protein 1